MPESRRCSQGHYWLVQEEAGAGEILCPECGQSAQREEDPSSVATLVLRTRRDLSPSSVRTPVSPLPHTVRLHPSEEESSPPQAWPDIPGYQILGEVGRGGMGVVYQARQVGLNRIVAIKMLHAGRQPDADMLPRLRGEAEALGQLQHPNIIQVFEVGHCSSGPYLVMEYAPGGSLLKRLNRTGHPPRLTARIVQTLARAIQAAHEKGIIHRDLKPGNVQLVEGPEIPLEECTLKISDFGLARRVDESYGLTLSGQVIGTPGYMAPEQAQGPSRSIGPAADVYALGVLLYEALTGRPPFTGATLLETVHLMLSSDPLPPSRLLPHLPRNLEIICLKCLQKDPARRYGTAGELADDLERYLQHQPIRARATSWWERLGMWARRQPGTAALAAGVVAVVLVSFVLVTMLWIRAESAHALSVAERERVIQLAEAERKARREAQQLSARLLMERGVALCEADEPGAGLLWMERSLAAAAEGSALRESLLLLLGSWSQQLPTLRYHHRLGDNVLAVAFSEEGQLVAGASESQVVVLDARTGKLVESIHALPGKVLALGAIGKDLVGIIRTKTDLQVLNLRTMTALGPPIRYWSKPRVATLSRDGKRLLVGFGDHGARVYRVETGEAEGKPWRHEGAVRAAAFSADGEVAATGGNDRLIQVWDVSTGKLQRTLRKHRAPVTALAFSPEGGQIVSGGEDNQVYLWQRSTGAVVHHLQGHQKGIDSVAFHPLLPLVATGSYDGTARLWDSETGKQIAGVMRHNEDVNVLMFSPKGDSLVTGGDDRSMRVWKVRRQMHSREPFDQLAPVRGLAVNKEESLLLTGGAQDGVCLWDVRSREVRKITYTSTAMAVVFVPGGESFLVGSYDGKVRQYDTKTMTEQGEPWKQRAPVLAMAVSPDGELVAIGCDDGDKVVYVRERRSGKVVHELVGHKRKVVSVAFSGDGRMLITGSWDRTARLWDVKTGQPVGAPLPHLDLVQAVTFSPEGTLALTGGDDFCTRMWEIPEGKLRGMPLRHPDRIQAVAFSPDGKIFATGGKAGQVRLWDAYTGKSLGAPLLHQWEVHALQFASNGRTLYSGSWDGTVRPWSVPGPLRRAPGDVRRWLEFQCGQQLLDPGILAPLDLDAWERRQ